MKLSTSAIYQLPTELCWDIIEYLGTGNVLDFAMTSKWSFLKCGDFIRKAQEEYKSRTILEWGVRSGRVFRRPLSGSSREFAGDLGALERFSTLVDASETGDVPKVKALLKDVSPDPPAPTSDYFPKLDVLPWVTPLEAAMHKNHHEIIGLLLDTGAEIRHSEHEHQFARLFFMPETQESTIRVLLNHPRTQSINWHRGKIAKLACSMRYEVSIISKLINVGLWSDETEYPTPVGESIITPFYVFTSQALVRPAYHDVKRLLLSDENRRNTICTENGYYPIHVAAENGDVDTVRMLVQEFGVDPNLCAANIGRHAPLYYAMLHAVHRDPQHALETIKALLEGGASPAGYPDCLEYAMERLPSALPLLLNAWLSKLGLSCRPTLLLIVAARLGKVPLINQLLPLCEDYNDRNSHFENPRLEALELAVHHGHDDAVKSLLPHIMNTDVQLERFDWALAGACRCCGESTVRALLRRCTRLSNGQWVLIIQEAARHQTVSIFNMALDRHRGALSWNDAKDILMTIVESGKTRTLCLFLQHVAIEKGHLGIVETLLNWDPDIADLHKQESHFALIRAIIHGRQEIAAALLATWIPSGPGADSRLVEQLEKLPMVQAAQLGQTEVLAQLFARGCHAHYRYPVNRRTLLSWAAENGHTETVRLLLAHGADVQALSIDGRTALHWAAANGQVETARLLLEAGAQLDAFDNSAKTPYILAITDGLETKGYSRDTLRYSRGKTMEELEPITDCRLAVVRVLLEYNTSIVDDSYLPGYLFAIEQDLPQIIRFHVEMGLVGLDEVDEGNKTLLIRAVENSAYAVAQLLVSMGCDVFRPDGKGNTPLGLAKDDRMIKVLYSRA